MQTLKLTNADTNKQAHTNANTQTYKRGHKHTGTY